MESTHGHGHEHGRCESCGHEEEEALFPLPRIIAAAAGLVLLHYLPLSGLPRFLAYMVPYLIVGYDVLLRAVKGVLHGEVFDENFLMAVATVGAVALGDYAEAAAVMLFYQTGELFQDRAVGKSRESIAALMDIRPDSANLEQGTELVKVSPEKVPLGSVIVVRPGEKIPLDGIVLEGEAALNTGALTGESLPRDVGAGDTVISGCIDLTGVLRIRTTKEFGESTVSKILELVEHSAEKKASSEQFITRFARVYTPAVCYGALALAVLPPLVSLLLGAAPTDFGPLIANPKSLLLGAAPLWGQWVYRALTFLVISCPCALVISIPLTFFAGIGGCGRAGVLVKGANYLEALAKARCVVFDKTGTLTRGVFQVIGVHHSELEERSLLEYAALAESYSSHPISRSLRAACGAEPDRSRVADVQELSGRGVTARVDGMAVAAGNDRLMEELGIAYIPCHHVGTVVHVAVDGRYAGHILISDVAKPGSAGAIRALRELGVKKTVMLTGDTEAVARQVAEELGVDDIHSQLFPADKVERIEALLSCKEKGDTLVFVGDGINDAPVLRRADVGVAMGALGSDAAIEAADVVLMDDEPMKIVTAIRGARKCMLIVYENIWFALGVKLVCLLLGALGLAGMWAAIFADVGVMIIAVLNAMRALKIR